MIDINKFSDIEDLSISEEMLGAYLEGNLHGSEFREVQNLLQSDAATSNLIDIVENDLDFLKDFDTSFHHEIEAATPTEDLFSDFSLPEITPCEMDSLIDMSSPLNEDIILGGDCHKFIADDGHSLHSDSQHNNHQHHDPELDFGVTDNIE